MTFLTFPTLSDLDLFSGVRPTCGLTRGQGEFLSSQQYNLERGKGRGEGCGKWVEPADLPTLHTSPLSTVTDVINESFFSNPGGVVCVVDCTASSIR